MKALQSKKFFVPDAIKEHPSNLGKSMHYDQIAFNIKLEPGMELFDAKNQKAGAFDFTESVYRAEDIEIYKKYFAPAALTVKDKDTKQMRPKTDKELESYYMSKYRNLKCQIISRSG